MLKNNKTHYLNILPFILCLFGLVFSLPLYGLGLLTLAMVAVRENIKSNDSCWFYHNKPALVLVALYVIYIIGLLHTTNIKEGLFTLEKTLSLALVPIILASLPPLKDKTLVKILSIFSFLIGVSCAILLTKAFADFYPSVKAVSLETIMQFTKIYEREKLVDVGFIQIHHPYLGLLIACSILIIITNFSKLSLKSLHLFLGIFLFLFLIQLKAKMSLVALLIAIAVYIAFKLKDFSIKFLVLYICLLLATLSFLVSFKFEIIEGAFHKIALSDGGSRLRNWESTIKTIKEAPILGHGTGDNNSALQKHRPTDSWEFKQQYNAHNQYLDISIRFGVIGLLYWLFLLGYFLWKSYSTRQYFFSLFIILFALCGFTEVLLARFHGVALFALILSIFANATGKLQKDDHPKTVQTA